MTSAILDEENIRQLLKQPPNNIAAIQQGALQALLDLYDRKVTRQEFIESAVPCITLHAQCAKMYILNNIQDVYQSGDLDQQRLTQSIEALGEYIRRNSEQVIDIVKRLEMCPNDEDKVH